MDAALRLDWEPADDPGEDRRRHLLAVSDALLEEIEVVLLHDSSLLPPALRDGIRGFQVMLGRLRPTMVPVSARAAHDLVLALQGRLLAANPRIATPRSHHGRAGGQAVMTVLQGGCTWKVLTLPPPGPGTSREEWLELVVGTVERARDRWEWALHQARTAARQGSGARPAWAAAAAAWANYWELQVECEKIEERIAAQVRTEALAMSA